MDSTAWALCRLMRTSLVEYFLCGLEDEKRYISKCEVNWAGPTGPVVFCVVPGQKGTTWPTCNWRLSR